MGSNGKCQARVAVIKTDFTWSEMFVETDGANYSNRADNARLEALAKLGMFADGHLPKGVEGVMVLCTMPLPKKKKKGQEERDP